MPDLEHLAKKIEAKYGIPRPANEQFLSDRRALMRLGEDVFKGISYLVCALISAYLLYSAASMVGVRLFTMYGGVVAFFIFMVFLVAGIDVMQLKTQYYKMFQRETYGRARWADVASLKQLGFITPNDVSPLPDSIPIGTFGWKHWLSLPIKTMARHMVVIGPPGSGKSASFFINVMRAWSQVGGAIALDIKGEIYKYAAHYYTNVYRLDLVNPECSDRFSLRECKGNPQLAYDVASFMIGYDPNSKGSGGGENPVWPQSACALLKCLLLHLPHIMEDPTPADVFKFITDHPYDKENKVDLLGEALMASPDRDVVEGWGVFSRLDPKVQSSVYFSMTTPLEPFRNPAVKLVMTLPTPEETARGCRVINFRDLRKKGTAIFVVVREGQASRMEAVLGTFFGMAMEVLRQTADSKEAAYTLIQADEAGNVPFRNLSEDVGVGRGRKMCFMFGYQNMTQPEKQFGATYAKAFRQSIGTRIFLPGLSDETADFAVKMIGKTTTFQTSSNDAVGRDLDSERLTEVGRDLFDATQLREMLPFHQAVAVIDTSHPIRIGFPPEAIAIDPRESYPARFDMNFPVTKEAAELYRQALMTPVELLIEGVRPALLGDEVVQFIQPPRSVTEPQPAPPHVTVTPGEYSPQADGAQTYPQMYAIPFAPYVPTGAPRRNQGEAAGGGESEDHHVQEVQPAGVRYTDEVVVVAPEHGQPGARPPRAADALSAMMRQQSQLAPSAGALPEVDEDAQAALLVAVTSVVDESQSVGDDFEV